MQAHKKVSRGETGFFGGVLRRKKTPLKGFLAEAVSAIE
jgi:hypothetical protein